jgi:succinoglycan biosynthesis protein ExoM
VKLDSLEEHEVMAEATSRDDRANVISKKPSVAVCVPTFKRPDYLEQLLWSLTRLQRDDLSMHVVVVDNDVDGSAEPIVRRFVALLPNVVYEIEPVRGIAAARNRLVSIAARISADYIAFVDDDEWVESTWLRNLMHVALESQADSVLGAVLPHYDAEVPSWIVAGRFFESPQGRVTGQRLRNCYPTANVLFKRDCLDGLEGPFHRAFDLTGGSDYHLSECLHRCGARVVWCDEALVHEHIPASRGNARWLLRRAFRSGVTFSQSARMLEPAPRRATRAARALAEVAGGIVLLPRSVIRGKAATLHTLRGCAERLGSLVGAVGFTYREYNETHGR